MLNVTKNVVLPKFDFDGGNIDVSGVMSGARRRHLGSTDGDI